MIGFLRSLFGFLDKLAAYFTARQMIDAGKAEQAVEAIAEQEKRIEQADQAVAVPDAARTERLRSRLDRSRSG